MSGWKNGVFYPGDNPAMAYESGSGAPASLLPENTIYKDTDTGDLYMNVDGVNKKYVADNGVKVYRALLTQSGTDAPVATVFENTFGENIVWTYEGPGVYNAGLESGDPMTTTENKIFVMIGANQTASFGPDETSLVGVIAGFQRPFEVGEYGVQVVTGEAGNDFVDGVLKYTQIEILLYP